MEGGREGGEREFIFGLTILMISISRASQPGEPPNHERRLEICVSKKDSHSIKPLILKAVPAASNPYLTDGYY